MIFIFHLDSGPEIGNGHYSRCFNLASSLSKMGYKTHLFTQSTNTLDRHAPWRITYLKDSNDTEQIINELQKYTDVTFIMDHYYIKDHINYQKQITQYVNQLVVIEDLPNRQHYCDVFINWNIYAKKEDYEPLMLKDDTIMLLGLNYLMLKENFDSVKRNNAFGEGIFVFFTTGDDKGMTLPALESLQKLGQKIECIIGNNNPDKLKIEAFCKQYANITLHIQTEKVAEIMGKCKIAVGAFGQNTYERMYLNLPTVGVELAENQKLVSKSCEELNVALNLGWYERVSGARIVEAVKIALQQDALNANSHFNNINILPLYLLLFAGEFKMKPICKDDKARILHWRNKKHVRVHMRNRSLITEAEHERWFNGALVAEKERYFIFFHKNKPLGFIAIKRIDVVKKSCEFGFYIGEEAYLEKGCGYLMQVFMARFVFEVLNMQRLECQVLKENHKAHDLYLKFGFKQFNETDTEFEMFLTNDTFRAMLSGHVEKLVQILKKNNLI